MCHLAFCTSFTSMLSSDALENSAPSQVNQSILGDGQTCYPSQVPKYPGRVLSIDNGMKISLHPVKQQSPRTLINNIRENQTLAVEEPVKDLKHHIEILQLNLKERTEKERKGKQQHEITGKKGKPSMNYCYVFVLHTFYLCLIRTPAICLLDTEALQHGNLITTSCYEQH